MLYSANNTDPGMRKEKEEEGRSLIQNHFFKSHSRIVLFALYNTVPHPTPLRYSDG